MSNDLSSFLQAITECKDRKGILGAPFGWPGGKSRSVDNIIPHLPHTDRYVEPFGGSGVILLNKMPVKNECFNDKYSGITNFYMCMQDPKKLKELEDLINASIHSRQYWDYCKEFWDTGDPVLRAFKWYYMVQYSFGKMGRNFGRSTGRYNADSGKIIRATRIFEEVHRRIKHVTIENQDYAKIIRAYDSSDTVFYCDPPYMGTDNNACYTLGGIDHEEFLDLVFKSKGYFAISSYRNDLYESYPWDKSDSWGSKQTISGSVKQDYTKTEEWLWIKSS